MNYHFYKGFLFSVFITVSLLCSVYGEKSFGELKFNHLKTEEGLSLINDLVRDPNGFLWIGNHNLGVMKYDGYEIVKYRHDPKDEGSLSNQLVQSMVFDHDDQLWIGTKNGLNRYIRETDSFVRYFHDVNDSFSLSDNMIYSVFVDSIGNLWVVCPNGLNLYQPETESFKRFLTPDVVKIEYVLTDIVQDHDGSFWLVDSTSVLFHFFPENGKFAAYRNPKGFTSKDFSYSKLFIDSTNQLWVLGRGNGLQYFNKETKVFTQIPSTGGGGGTNGKLIWDAVEYPRGQLIFAVNQSGLAKMNMQDQTFTYQNSSSRYGYHLAGDGVTTLCVDEEGILWVGTSRSGLDYHNPKENRFQSLYHVPGVDQSIGGKVVVSFFEDNEGLLWICQDGTGISIYDRQSYHFEHIRPNATDGLLNSGTIRNVVEDSKGRFWVSSWDGGIVVWERKDGKLIRLTEMDPLLDATNSSSIWRIYIDRKDRLWITTPTGSIYGYGHDLNPFYFRKEEDIYLDYTPWIEEMEGIGLTFAYADQFSVFNEKKQDFELIFNTPDSSILKYDGNRFFYIGTIEHGVYIYDFQGNQIGRLSEENGLSNNLISSLEIDLNGKVWISTNSGLDSYDPITQKIINYRERDGIYGNLFFPESSMRLKSGEIIFGGSGGLTLFNPDELVENDYVPRIFLNEIRINNKAIDFKDPNCILCVHPHFLKKLELAWYQNYLGFSFSAINLTFPFNNQYAYMLEGLDDDWIYSDSINRSATYTNINPGEYFFRVKASNNDGIWNEEGTSIQIIVKPPFWKTLLFYVTCVFAVIYLVFLFIRHREKKLRHDKWVLEAKVLERTETIEHQNHELERQGDELLKHKHRLEDIVVERTRELVDARDRAEKSDQLKSHFLANMSHEIRTPLNAIIGLSSFLGDEELSKTERDEFISAITQNSDSLLRVIEDIIDFSMLETNQLKIDIDVININQLLDILHSSFYSTSLLSQNEFVVNNHLIEESLHLFTDPYRLKQIMDNLISNALKFTKQGRVEFGIRRCDEDVEFYVTDTGPGIPDAMQDSIFEEFFKLEKDQLHAMRGVGLGLALCNRLSKKLGGDLQLQSELGIGSTFTLSFPFSSFGEKGQIDLQADQEVDMKQWKGKQFLIIEDEYTNYLYLNEILKRGAANVDYASDGNKGLGMIRDKYYDVVFLDIQMPGMDGYDVLKEIRLINRDLKVVSQTAYSFPEDRAKIRMAGFDGCLWKPIPVSEVEVVLSQLL